MRNFFVKLASFLMAALFLFSASAEAAVVQCGDTISYEQSALSNPDNSVTIDWQQSFKSRSADYVELPAVDTENKAVFPLFVEKSELPGFQKQSKCDEATGICTVKVDSEFQYGQNYDKTFRFLVYHNKSEKPYQHRFVNTTTLGKFSEGLKDVADSKIVDALGSVVPEVAQAQKLVNTVIEQGQKYIGDYLRDC